MRGNQIELSSISAIWVGNVIAPFLVETRIKSPSLTPSFVARIAEITATDGCAVPAKFSSPSCSEPASRSKRQDERSASSPDTETFPAATGLKPTPLSQFPREENSLAATVTVGSLIGVPISSANIERILKSLRFSESTAASKLRARPSQLTKLPLFSATAATGRTTFAISVIALFRISRETTNAFTSPSCKCAEISSGSTPPTNTASMSPLCKPFNISLVSRPRFVGRVETPHAVCRSTRALASLTGRPPGSRFPIAPASRAPRSPARRGIHANFAPLRSANAATADNAPVDSARRSPTKITDLFVSPDISAIAPASLPAAVAINFAANFSLPRDANGAIVEIAKPRFLTCLYRRKKTIGDSSSGSKPASNT